MDDLLLVFVKNPVEGMVKTRLAESVGDKKALQIYRQLLRHTYSVAEPLDADVQIWYSERKPGVGEIPVAGAVEKVQEGEDLGERMSGAFARSFEDGYRRVVIIGSDCAQLTTEHIREAFEKLDTHSVVIGPSEDGGYYLLGMTSHFEFLFDSGSWSTEKLYGETVDKLEQKNISYAALPVLNDVDTLSDWQEVRERFNGPGT